MHKSGFVNIIGNPNVGKSTLMNALVGEKLSIITLEVMLESFSPTRAFIRVDFPTLWLPMMFTNPYLCMRYCRYS